MAQPKGLWQYGHKIKQFDVIPAGGGEPQDLAGQLAGIKYYEDIIDSSVHIQILINDTYGLLNAIPIRSGNTVHLKIEHPSAEMFEFTSETVPLVITNISDNISDQKREVYTLTCETPGALSNHTNRVWTKFTGSIAANVSKILDEKIEGEINTVDTTQNTFEFY